MCILLRCVSQVLELRASLHLHLKNSFSLYLTRVFAAGNAALTSVKSSLISLMYAFDRMFTAAVTTQYNNKLRALG